MVYQKKNVIGILKPKDKNELGYILIEVFEVCKQNKIESLTMVQQMNLNMINQSGVEQNKGIDIEKYVESMQKAIARYAYNIDNSG